MNLWFVFALMTVAAVFAVLWPLGRRYQPRAEGTEAAVYRDQLAEVDRDLAGGLIAAAEADSARIEISRRLLAVDRSRPPALPSGSLRRAVAIVALVGLPLAAVALYLPLGSPQLGDFPLALRARRRPTPSSRWSIWWRRWKRIWKRIRPTAAAGPCWRRCWGGSAVMTMRCAPGATPSPMPATAPSAAPILAKR